MRGVTDQSLGTIIHVAPQFPHLVKKIPTLRDVSAADLPAADRTAGLSGFKVAMNCNGQFPVTMKLTDANASGNTGSRLTPT